MSRAETVAAFLRGQTTLSLATAAPDGAPCVAPLFYLYEEGPRLYWFSARSSRHSRNLSRCPDVSAAVYRHAERWQEIRGVQMRGTASRVSDRALRRAVTAAYTERFHLGPAFRAAIAASSLFVLQPSWIRYIDNSRRFGYRFEMNIGDPAAPAPAPPETR